MITLESLFHVKSKELANRLMKGSKGMGRVIDEFSIVVVVFFSTFAAK